MTRIDREIDVFVNEFGRSSDKYRAAEDDEEYETLFEMFVK